MTDQPNSMLVHCGSCKHEWFALKLPMLMRDAAVLIEKMVCPNCNEWSRKIYCGPAPVDKLTHPQNVLKITENFNMSDDDLVKRLRKNVMCGDAVIEEAANRIEKLEAALWRIRIYSREAWECKIAKEALDAK